jgi:hypothetical protein
MKTIELKWIEDDNHVVAEDAYVGLQDLIEAGVFKNIKAECKDDILYITGEQEELDKVVMKIQKAYAKYGQIIIKEAKKSDEGLRIESYDENVQDIFNHTLLEFEEIKKNNKAENYITNLGKYSLRFKKLKEAAKGKDKATIQKYIDEILTLTENAEIKKIKPIKKINEDSLDDFDDTDIKKSINAQSDEVKQFVQTQRNNLWSYANAKMDALCEKCGCKREYKDMYFSDWGFSGRKPGARLAVEIKLPYKMYKKLSEKDIADWFYSDESCPFIPKHKSVSIYTRDMSPEVMIDFNIPEYVEPKKERKPRKPRDPNKGYKKPDYINPDMKGGVYKDGDVTVYEMPEDNESYKAKYNAAIMEQLSNLENWGIIDEDQMNESLLSAKELKKKLQRVCLTWASIEGITFEAAWDELRKRKSVKDMLDFYTVEEIIEDLKKKKIESDDELEDKDKV